MGKQAIEGKRSNLFMLEPERLTLVFDKQHPLYDPRVEHAPDEAMVANISMNGVLEPIIVRKNGELIEVVAGRGRTKATLEANRRLVAEGKPPILIPCILKGGTDVDLFGVMVSENEIRREDTMLVKGMKARKLLNMGYSVQEISVTFGVSRQAIENWLAAEELPDEIKEAVESGEITVTAALELAKAGHTREEQVKRFEDLKKQGAKPTVHNTKTASASKANKPAPKIKTRSEIEKHLDTLDVGGEEYEQGYINALRWVLNELDEEKMTMRKDSFYTCIKQKNPDTEETEIKALKISGFAEGDIGLHEIKYNSELNTWVATHIPTGLLLIDKRQEYHKTKSSALKSAKAKINLPSFEQNVKTHMESEGYKTFQQSRYDQCVTYAYGGSK